MLAARSKQIIDTKFAKGILPGALPAEVLGGTCKAASACAGCELTIVPGDSQIETNGGDGEVRIYHGDCGYYVLQRMSER